MKVLIVEDSRFLRLSDERALQQAGYEAITAADGEEGLRLALERRPDLVILDLMLPKLPGHEVRELRKNPQTACIPVMVVTSLPSQTSAKFLSKARPLISKKRACCWTKAVSFSYRTCGGCSRSRELPRSADGAEHLSPFPFLTMYWLGLCEYSDRRR
jgi:CheY-like chemotaxis protein